LHAMCLSCFIFTNLEMLATVFSLGGRLGGVDAAAFHALGHAPRQVGYLLLLLVFLLDNHQTGRRRGGHHVAVAVAHVAVHSAVH
jgi:hypothetical protein